MGIGGGECAVTIDIAQARAAHIRRAALLPRRATLAMGNHDGCAQAAHTAHEYRGRCQYFYHYQARLVLFRGIALEARPVTGAGNAVGEMGQHLAAVAHAEREGVGALEEGFEACPRALIELNGAGPTTTGAEHVTLGKATTGGQPLHVLQCVTAGNDVGHMHIDGSEAGAVKGRRHFHMAIHTLLAQDGDARSQAAA